MPDLQDSSLHVKPFVYQNLGCRALHFSINEVQSRMKIEDPDALDLEYTRTMMGFVLFNAAPRQITMIGLGGGSLAKYCHRHLPASSIQVVEINPHVIALRDEFEVPADDARFTVHRGDGARFVRESLIPSDVLMVDGFDADGQPARLSSQRFYDDCFEALTPDGMLVVNLHNDHARHDIYVDRIRRSFNDAVLLVKGGDLANSVVFAFRRPGFDAPGRAGFQRPKMLSATAARQLLAGFTLIESAMKHRRIR